MFQWRVNKMTIWSAFATLALLFAVSPVLAYVGYDWFAVNDPTRDNTPVVQQQMQVQNEQMSKMTGRIGDLQCARSLLNTDLKNNNNETLGKVKELIIDDNRNVLRYIIIESNGTFHPVPWSAFDVTPYSIVLNVEKTRFMDSPQTGSAYLEKLGSPDFRKDIWKFYSEQIAPEKRMAPVEITAANEMEKPVLRECSSVIGLKVENIQGKELAAVRTVLFDTRQGELTYAVVGFGGLFGLGEKTAAVPWTSLAIQPDQRVAYLDADRAALESAVINEANPAKLTDPAFQRSISETFGARPYWETLGFVPPGETKITFDAWKADSKYNAFYNPENISELSGVIRSVSIFTPEWGAAPGLKLTVEIGEGELVTVHCGPQQYALQREMNFRPGLNITVTGSKTKIGDENIVMASEIKVGSKVLLLRDTNTGEPKWNIEKMQSRHEEIGQTEFQQLLKWGSQSQRGF